MKLLVLGGTRFLGRHLVQQALDGGHAVTLLHRGLSQAGLFPRAEHRIADRDDEFALRTALAGGVWDCAIDTSAYVPRQVRSLGAALQGRVGHYQLASTISVYAGFANAGNDEAAPLAALDDPTTEAISGATYGGLKALCEAEARAAFGDTALVVRPGLIVGPHDPTGRYTWWVQRLQRGGKVLAPGDPQMPVQCIDVRDLAAWMLAQAVARTAGTFNLTGPEQPTTMAALLAGMASAIDSEVRFEWVDEDFLIGEGVAPWTELPLWLPRDSVGLHRTPIARALATGLRCRPIGQTALDTAAWAAAVVPIPTDGGPPRAPVGLSLERETEILQAWHQRAPGPNPSMP
jgi:2'-hydroxyisoflavone reductase